MPNSPNAGSANFDSTRAALARRLRTDQTTIAIMAIVLLAYAILVVALAIYLSFPTDYDELEHLSVARSLYESPVIFPDASRFLILRADDLTRFSAIKNYINHPSLYYFMLSPIEAVAGHSYLPFRLVNGLLAIVTLALILVCGCRALAGGTAQRMFALLAACFPKAPLIGAMINNDNLAAFAGALVFAGVTGAPGAIWWLSIGLVLAGWSKLTALIALGGVVALHRGWCVAQGKARLLEWRNLLLLLSCLLAALPYLVTLAHTGHLLYVNVERYGVPAAARPVLTQGSFILFFLSALAQKWPAAEALTPFWLVLVIQATLLLLVLAGSRGRTAKPVGLIYLASAVGMIAIHMAFGWQAYRNIGDLTIAQARYYNVLWPGVAFAAANGAALIARRSGIAANAMLAICIMPTVLGGLVLAVV